MTIPDQTLLQAAAVGPAVAGLVWLALFRWPLIRRAGGAAVWLAAHAAAWAVFWRLYKGEAVGWRGLEPGLLQASIVPFAEIGVFLALMRAETLRNRAATGSAVALCVSTSAVVFGAYSTSLIAQALFLPVPTLAAVGAAFVGSEGRGFPGFGGLAAADLVGVLGLAVLFDRSGSSVTSAGEIGMGSALLLLCAAAKAGALPGVATWQLTGSDGPAAPVTAALRGQGMALAALGGPIISGVDGSVALAATAAAITLLAGGVALRVPRAHTSLAAISGAAAAVPFLALGLGGSIGIRAYLTLFPAFLLASGVAFLVGWPGQEEEVAGRASRFRRWAGGAALVVSVASLAGLPPSAGFPGTWLTLDLAVARAAIEPLYVVLAGAAALGLVAAAMAAVPLLRSVRPGRFPALVGGVGAGLLLYMGSFPVRVGGGWWIRVEEGLGAPRLLSFAGAPGLPPMDGKVLLAAATAVVVPIALVILLGRGFRDANGTFDGFGFLPNQNPGPRMGRALSFGRELRVRSERLYVGMAAALLIEAAVAWSIIQLVIRAGRRGFL
jgi:hypothetical protein